MIPESDITEHTSDTSPAVRLVHNPTQLWAYCTTYQSQYQNRRAARAELEDVVREAGRVAK